ncbi:hypothetical protein EB061_01640 [bacterium]|jgi:hypothetical protein|nr:hypothetical protein [bacterium]
MIIPRHAPVLFALLGLCGTLAHAAPFSASGTMNDGPLIERFPGLQGFIHKEEASDLFFGFGFSPMTLVNGKFGFAASVFQLHYLQDSWDIEILNLSFGKAFADGLGKEDFFLLRMSPKFLLFKNLSLGPALGIEFVNFPEVTAQVTRNNLYSKPFPYSTFGYFFGGILSKTIEVGKGGAKMMRISTIYIKEHYSVDQTGRGWSYYFQNNDLNFDKGPIAPGSMFMLEISYLY